MSTRELWIQRLKDTDVRLLFQLHHGLDVPGLTRFFAAVSRLGDGVAWYGLILAVAGLGGAEGRAAALQMTLTGLALTGLYKLMKHGVARPRPCDVFAQVCAIVPPLDRFSFPSGHTMHAVAFTWMATAFAPALGVLLIPFTAMVMLSRMVLGLHYPSDVAAGATIGMLAAALATSLS